MSDMTRDLLIRGLAAAKSGEKKEARYYLEWALRLDPPIEQKMEAWYWLSEISETHQQQREYLEEILANDPGDARARRKLAIIDGKLDPNKMVNPDLLSQKAAAQPVKTNVDRFTCPTCGGKMTFTPDGSSLTCEYCDSRQRMAKRFDGEIEEDNFLISMNTTTGHLVPVSEKTITCQGCAAVFILPPNQMTKTCPYCSSAHFVLEEKSSEIILPNSLFPFRLNAGQAKRIVVDTIRSQTEDDNVNVGEGRAIYVPVWTFDIGGQISWSCEIQRRDQWIPIQDRRTIYANDIPVLATRNLPEPCKRIMTTYDWSELIPFDKRYLADWFAETFQISLGDASLNARKITADHESQLIPAGYEHPIQNLKVKTSSMIVETYKLALVPVWIFTANFDDQQEYPIAVNGYNGKPVFPVVQNGIRGWLDRFLNW